jgi:NTP pyrophosphatase (non-canonical NTP hydrolase)
MINELAKQIHKNAIDKGFFEKEKNIGEMLCLIHSEVSEALEADRNDMYMHKRMESSPIGAVNGWVSDEDFWKSFRQNVKGTFEEELADIMIRVMDLAAYKNIDLEAHIKAKMRYNSLREKYHGKKY